MESDTELYKIFKADPSFLFLLLGFKVESWYSFESVELKEFSRIMDGYMTPDDPKEPCFIVEFQNQKLPEIYPRWFMETGAAHLEHIKKVKGSRSRHQKDPTEKEISDREFHGILIFGEESLDPKVGPWCRIVQDPNSGFSVCYPGRVA